jgi:protein-S-isoprenylcysteine O-methyltransferase Ste14
LVLILLLIPTEEVGLERAYGAEYIRYKHKTRKLVPILY